MNWLETPIALITAVLIFNAANMPAVAKSKDTPSQTAIQKLVDAFVEATNAKDARSFGNLFAEDGEFTNPVGMSFKGRSEIEKFHAGLFSENNRPSFAHAHLTVVNTSIRLLRPDVAAVDIKWEQTGAIAPNGAPWGTRRGILSWVVTRENGAWSIAVWHNMELPAQ